MVKRNSGSFTLAYDPENRLTTVSGGASATFVYDGDGNLVKKTLGTAITSYVGNYFEWTGSTSTMVKYYYHGGRRVAMRVGHAPWYFLLTDHLTSTAITATSAGSKSAELRYKAWGETRYTYGTTPTAYKFTGQRLDESTGLYYYGARFYDPVLGRFISADTVVPEPGNPQALNRYAYTLNNPVRYTDPTGHWLETLWDIANIVADIYAIKREGLTWGNGVALLLDVVGLVGPGIPAAGGIVRGRKVVKAVTEVAGHADEAADALRAGKEIAQEAVEVAGRSGRPPIVIGENMAERVVPYARQIGAQTINDFIPAERWSMEANETWIRQMRAEGREIIDIGPDFDRRLYRATHGIRPDSEAYNLERGLLQGYEEYRKVFQRSGKYWGGVPGFDWE